MLQNLFIKSTNFIYVYHSGDVGYLKFMGMTIEAYKNVKNNYKVTAFISSDKDITYNLNEVDEDFNKKEDRYIGRGVKYEESIKCVKEFFSEVLHGKILSELEGSLFLVSKKKMIGIPVLQYTSESDLQLYCKDLESVLDFSTSIDFSGVLENRVVFGKRELSYLKFIKNLYNGESEYCIISIYENTSVSIVSAMNITNIHGTSFKKRLDGVMNIKPTSSFVLYDEAYRL